MARKVKQKRDGNCAECGHYSPCLRPRKLCYHCYRKPEVLARHPLDPVYGKREPTAAELEQIIAEQSRRLPEWWDREVAESIGRLGQINREERVAPIIEKMVRVRRRR